MIATVAFGAAAQNKNPHAKAHKGLIAKSTDAKDQINLSQSQFIDFGFEEPEPEIDIYTEGWNSKRVNPFSEAQVPNTDLINLQGFCMPTKTRLITSPYGYRKRFGRMHKGIDINIKSNDTIYAAFDGKVRLTNYEAKGYGNYVILRHPNKLETVYGHLNKFLVKPDQMVKAGDPIALGGSTGRSTGPHLHFETRYMGYAINPSAIVDYPNGRLHADTYTFNKNTYTKAYNGNSKPAPAKTYTASAERNTYTVRRGDTLATIARKNGISLKTLCKLNGIKETSPIHPDQVLKVK